MKRKLFEHIGGNLFKLREDDDISPEGEPAIGADALKRPEGGFNWDRDKDLAHEPQKQFDVRVGEKKYTYFVTPMPDGDLDHHIEDQHGSLVSMAQDADPKTPLTPEQVQAEVQKFLASPQSAPPKQIPHQAQAFRGGSF